MSVDSPRESVPNAVDLRASIEAALSRGARLLRLPAELEARYQTATWRSRSRSLKTWLRWVALIDLLCLGIDALVMPAH